jgi:hypothetical protein
MILPDLSPGFHVFGFCNSEFLQNKVVNLASKPKPGDQTSVCMTPSDRVAQLYPQAPRYLFVSFYDSQRYGGGILPRLHTGS